MNKLKKLSILVVVVFLFLFCCYNNNDDNAIIIPKKGIEEIIFEHGLPSIQLVENNEFQKEFSVEAYACYGKSIVVIANLEFNEQNSFLLEGNYPVFIESAILLNLSNNTKSSVSKTYFENNNNTIKCIFWFYFGSNITRGDRLELNISNITIQNGTEKCFEIGKSTQFEISEIGESFLFQNDKKTISATLSPVMLIIESTSDYNSNGIVEFIGKSGNVYQIQDQFFSSYNGNINKYIFFLNTFYNVKVVDKIIVSGEVLKQ